MIFNFYDIESLENVWTLSNYSETENILDVYLLCDDFEFQRLKHGKRFADKIREKNRNFTGGVRFYNLKNQAEAERLAATFGLNASEKANDPELADPYQQRFRLTCDTDYSYNEDTMPYYLGYNSFNYDTTMLSYLLYRLFPVGQDGRIYFSNQVKASDMRKFNNFLFTDAFIGRMPDLLCYIDQLLASDTEPSDLNHRPELVNDLTPDYGQLHRIRRNMLISGRHLDVAKLNEKMTKTAEKRILGMLGYQILESDKLDNNSIITSEEELAELIAYNASDVVNLAELFRHKFYQSQFMLKRQLLRTYDVLIYNKDKNEYKADARPQAVSLNRLTVDSSSAQFAARSLAPYEPLGDIAGVSFLYPSEKKARERGVERVDVLEEAKKFFYSLYPVDTDDAQKNRKNQQVRKEFHRHFYDYYAAFRGKNFNDSRNYRKYCQEKPLDRVYSQKEIMPDADTMMFYYDKDGNPTSGYIKFSIGGLHGAEYNYDYYMEDLTIWKGACRRLDEARALFHDDPYALKSAGQVQLSDGNVYPAKEFIGPTKQKVRRTEFEFVKKPKKPLKKDGGDYEARMAEWKKECEILSWIKMRFCNVASAAAASPVVCMEDGQPVDPANYVCLGPEKEVTAYAFKAYPEKPAVFKTDKTGETKLNKRYVYTSCGLVNHEDFTSYYPWLLIGMDAFQNPGLGYDRYEEMYQQKEINGRKMKDKTRYSDDERELFKDMREGNKLIINSASGAADAVFENNIRMNNRILSMRMIGQIFSWRIGQAQAYAGARVPSTNTDGLYTVMEWEENAKILERESASTGVEIEPELTYLVSKDANNRLEADPQTRKIEAASGELGCHNGPSPTKALSHAAILDWAMCQYLLQASDPDNRWGVSMDSLFDRELGLRILKSACRTMEPVHWLKMMQTIIASSPRSRRYIYGFENENSEPFALQHYNRVFFIRSDAAEQLKQLDPAKKLIHVRVACSRKITPTQKVRRERDGLRPQIHDETALRILETQGISVSRIDSDHEASTASVTGVSPEWSLLVENSDLRFLDPKMLEFIQNNLDYGIYLDKMEESFNNIWMNATHKNQQELKALRQSRQPETEKEAES